MLERILYLSKRTTIDCVANELEYAIIKAICKSLNWKECNDYGEISLLEHLPGWMGISSNTTNVRLKIK